MKRLLLLTALLCIVSVSYGLQFTVDKITYTTIDNNNVKVTGCDKFNVVNVVIPSEVTYNEITYQVIEIADNALYSPNMETLVISEGVEKIGAKAINGSKKLQTVELPSTLHEIGNNAFSRCSNLTKVTFPNGSTLVTISDEAFYPCDKLDTISFHSIDELYSGVVSTFPETLVSIGQYAFREVPAFKNLILHGGIQMEYGAFWYCPNIEYLWLQEGITEIAERTFLGLYHLTYIVLPSSLTKVGSGAFSYGNQGTPWPRTFFFLADVPFKQFDDIPSILIKKGDHVYVKESAIDRYKTAWANISWYNISNYIDYKIPFNADLTYSTNYREFDMDFHVAAEKGNKPFVATSYSDISVTFTSIDDYIVPAETGIVIRKNSDEDTWFQIAEEQGHTLSMNNYLKGVTYSDVLTPTTDDGYVNFVLNNGVFCRFNNAGMLGDHKAYLQLPSQTADAILSFSFENNSDGITEINNRINENGTIYSLNGVRVSNPKKGIYIKNGKKVIIK